MLLFSGCPTKRGLVDLMLVLAIAQGMKSLFRFFGLMRKRHQIVEFDGSFFVLRSVVNRCFIFQLPQNERVLVTHVVKTFGVLGCRNS
ncbi:MAG: hypothetical protein ACI87E_002224 [Mariniblastus sp.]|jgi:hypothetical protein